MKKLALAVAAVLLSSCLAFAVSYCWKCSYNTVTHTYLCQGNTCGGPCSCDASTGTSCQSCGACTYGHCIFPCDGPTSATTASMAQSTVWGQATIDEVTQTSKGAGEILRLERDNIMKAKPLSFHDSRGEARIQGDPDIDNNFVVWTKQYDPATGNRIFTITHQLKEDAVGPNLLVLDGGKWHLYNAPDGIFHEKPEHAITEVAGGVIKR